MKPLNADNQSCDPISSNCVIWQGPDIECLKLCKGDTISDVTFKLATELCKVLDILDITAYDLSCFNLTTCAPEDFQALIQFLIGRVCKLEQCTGCIPDCGGNSVVPVTPTPASGCPDCTVAIASCFQYTNQFGDIVTSMQLSDYVTTIGNKICDLILLNNLQTTTVATLVKKVEVLENAPPPEYLPPTITPTCVLPAVPTEMDVLLAALEQQFCQLRGATGTPDQLYQNISKQCAGLNSEEALNGSGATMSALPGWAASVNTLAQGFGNMWLTVCDMRQAIKNIQLNCCPAGCDGINLSFTASIDGSDILSIFMVGTIPPGFLQCLPSGTQIKVTDGAGGTATFIFDLIGYLNNPAGFPVNLAPTSINTALDLTIEIEPCLTNSATGATCERCLEYVLVNSALCPTLNFVAGQTSINYNFISNAGDYTYNVQLWDNAGAVMILNNVHVISGAQPVNGIFNGLGAGTNYKVRVVITATACPSCGNTVCSFSTIATTPPPCPAPVITSVIIMSGGNPVAGPQIALNRACGFAVLASTTITNTGATTLTGDLGLAPGTSVVGAPTVIGASHINDQAAIDAQTDLTTAYNSAAGYGFTTDLSGQNLGGMVLTPGIYKFSSSAQLTGQLTLNGSGTYIFQIGSTLVTAAGSTIILTNGATADNVFFTVGSSATLGLGSTFNGVILAVASITHNGGTVNGALMARTGAITFSSASTVTYQGCP